MTKEIELFERTLLRLDRRRIRRVLLPSDMSERSWQALGIAVELAASAGAELHLLHVVQPGISTPNPDGFPSDEEVRSRTWSSSPDSLRARAKPHLDGLQIERVEVESHDISKAIDSYATEQEIDLIVLASARTALRCRRCVPRTRASVAVRGRCLPRPRRSCAASRRCARAPSRAGRPRSPSPGSRRAPSHPSPG